MSKDFKDVLGGPYLVPALSVILGVTIYLVEAHLQLGPVWGEVVNNIATAVLVSGTFGVIFELYSKNKIIKEVVRDAIGQTRSVELGVSDFLLDVSDINITEDIVSSSSLCVGYRYSGSFIQKNRSALIRRICNNDKGIKVVTMKDVSSVPRSLPDSGPSPEDFFRNKEVFGTLPRHSVELFKTNSHLNYNFVQVDRGIWIKMYLNARGAKLPPAFFVKSGSSLYSLFRKDIEALFTASEKV